MRDITGRCNIFQKSRVGLFTPRFHWNVKNCSVIRIRTTKIITSKYLRIIQINSMQFWSRFQDFHSNTWIPLICLHQLLRLAKGSIPWWCKGKRRTYKHHFVPLVGTGGCNLSSYCPRFWLRLSGHQQAHVWWDGCYIVFVEVVASRGSVPYASHSQMCAPCSCCGQT